MADRVVCHRLVQNISTESLIKGLSEISSNDDLGLPVGELTPVGKPHFSSERVGNVYGSVVEPALNPSGVIGHVCTLPPAKRTWVSLEIVMRSSAMDTLEPVEGNVIHSDYGDALHRHRCTRS